MGLFEEFEWRGLVQDHTEGVGDLLRGGSINAYIGFDPSGDSLHVGSLMPLVALMRLQRAGHRPFAVVGGATGMIGDPSGKSKERNLLDEEQLAHNVAGIREQISRFIDFDAKSNPAVLVNNLDWLGEFRIVDFLREVGKHFTVSGMIAKESVRRRLGSDQGISFTEFSYLILQAYDFYELCRRHDVVLQLGGSDQWGNITSGIDLVRSKLQRKVHGLTWPLVMTSSGVKFGKTEEGAVWLSPKRTSPYRFYQFWLNSDDADAMKYLRYFTFLNEDDVAGLEAEHAQAPGERRPHRRLADEATRLVHGESELTRARRATEVFFGGELGDLALEDVLDVFADVPSAELPRATFEGDGAPLLDVLVSSGLMPSKKEARRSVEGGGVSVNNRRVSEANATLRVDQAIGGRVFVLRKGRKNYHVVRIVG